jgi:demethylmenaquinone methyltransferase/2-methoxy-6-polyprenyl-1,4-benzoquinol methylase
MSLAPHPELREYYGDAGNKRTFVRRIFDRTAPTYDRIERMMALGTGGWYRRQALRRAGLTPAMRTLDVAAGTGLLCREAIHLTANVNYVLALDASAGMLKFCRDSLQVRAVLAVAEELPIGNQYFDFLSMGYALRHLTDLGPAFAEFFRVLKPGGKLCLLEISRPTRRISTALLRTYMRLIVPTLSRFTTRDPDSQLLWQYYWDTIESCVPPETVLDALSSVGFTNVKRHVELGIFSEYTAQRPQP